MRSFALALALPALLGACRDHPPAPRPDAAVAPGPRQSGTPFTVRPELASRLLRVDQAVVTRELDRVGVRLDVTAQAAYRGSLYLFALDGTGREVGRDQRPVDLALGAASVMFLLGQDVDARRIHRVEVTGVATP